MIKNITVIGAGTMGNGIAHVFAQYGYNVTLTDINDAALGKAIQTISRNAERQVNKGVITQATKERILLTLHTTTALDKGVEQADMVIEAATENINTKASLFKQIDKLAPSTAILATNTSSISITALAAVTQRPEKVIGMHFMNPVPVMQLVEIINGYATAPEVTREVEDISKALNKVPCIVKDYPGFIANRILMPMINEAIHSLYEHVAGIAEIDTIMKLGMAHPMGPLQLADFIGLDVCLNIMQVLYNGFGNPKYAPCPLLVNMVAAGRLGVKTGEGFYRYTAGSREMVPAF